MAQSTQPSPDETVRAVYACAADLMKQGLYTRDIEKQLVQKGLDAESAHTVVTNLGRARNEALRKAAIKNMWIGGIICIVGILVTVATYNAAASSPTGGSYIVAWGAIIFGGIQFVRGLMSYQEIAG